MQPSCGLLHDVHKDGLLICGVFMTIFSELPLDVLNSLGKEIGLGVGGVVEACLGCFLSLATQFYFKFTY